MAVNSMLSNPIVLHHKAKNDSMLHESGDENKIGVIPWDMNLSIRRVSDCRYSGANRWKLSLANSVPDGTRCRSACWPSRK